IRETLSADVWNEDKDRGISRHDWIREVVGCAAHMNKAQVAGADILRFFELIHEDPSGMTFKSRQMLLQRLTTVYEVTVRESNGKEMLHGYDLLKRVPRDSAEKIPALPAYLNNLLSMFNRTSRKLMTPTVPALEKLYESVFNGNIPLSRFIRTVGEMTKNEINGEYERFHRFEIKPLMLAKALYTSSPDDALANALLGALAHFIPPDSERSPVESARAYLVGFAMRDTIGAGDNPADNSELARNLCGALNTVMATFQPQLMQRPLFLGSAERRQNRLLMESSFSGAILSAEPGFSRLERVCRIMQEDFSWNTQEDPTVLGKIIYQERVIPAWLRELVQNARDAIKGAARISTSKITPKIVLRSDESIPDTAGRSWWYVTISDPVGMFLATVTQDLFSPDASTKNFRREFVRIVNENALLPASERLDITQLAEKLRSLFVMTDFRDTPEIVSVQEIINLLNDPRFSAELAEETTKEDSIISRFEQTHKEQLARLFAGEFGMGFFTVFADSNEVVVRSGRNGKLYDFVLEPIRVEGKLVLLRLKSTTEYADPNGEYKGSSIRWGFEITKDNRDSLERRQQELADYVQILLGGVQDCEILFAENGAEEGRVSDQFEEPWDKTEQLTVKMSKYHIARVTCDQLYLTDPRLMLELLPEQIGQWLIREGVNLDFAKTAQLNIDRNSFNDAPHWRMVATQQLIFALARQWRAGTCVIPGLPSYADFLRTAPRADDVSPEDRAAADMLMKSTDATAFNELMRKRFAGMQDFSRLLCLAETPGTDSALESRRKLWYDSAPADLAHTELPSGTMNSQDPFHDREIFSHEVLLMLMTEWARQAVKGKETLPIDGAEGEQLAQQLRAKNVAVEQRIREDTSHSLWRSVALHLPIPEIGMSAYVAARDPGTGLALRRALDASNGQPALMLSLLLGTIFPPEDGKEAVTWTFTAADKDIFSALKRYSCGLKGSDIALVEALESASHARMKDADARKSKEYISENMRGMIMDSRFRTLLIGEFGLTGAEAQAAKLQSCFADTPLFEMEVTAQSSATQHPVSSLWRGLGDFNVFGGRDNVVLSAIILIGLAVFGPVALIWVVPTVAVLYGILMAAREARRFRSATEQRPFSPKMFIRYAVNTLFTDPRHTPFTVVTVIAAAITAFSVLPVATLFGIPVFLLVPSLSLLVVFLFKFFLYRRAEHFGISRHTFDRRVVNVLKIALMVCAFTLSFSTAIGIPYLSIPGDLVGLFLTTYIQSLPAG
ncbi:MAG: hypothetical protein WCG51_04270, partial [Elusimicrobiota bacterium]